mmetsp:Transcript_99930/g.172373  ORF Transcript_99930/g.172373 Transcript_99930/m.172373 type:complete len:81 (+) Transcript_99930:137-379(+)
MRTLCGLLYSVLYYSGIFCMFCKPYYTLHIVYAQTMVTRDLMQTRAALVLHGTLYNTCSSILHWAAGYTRVFMSTTFCTP